MTDPVAEIVRTLHTRDDGLSLVKIRYRLDGHEAYGIVRRGGELGAYVVEFAGTKAEAKRRYGTWRSAS